MYYQFYEMNHAVVGPLRAAADATRLYFKNPLNPLAHTTVGRSVAAACELFERSTRRYGKPAFGLDSTLVGGTRVPVQEKIVWQRPFCKLIHFERRLPETRRRDPKLLIVAPMSGHYATLLRGTVEAMLPRHEVFITDWEDARMVPLTEGRFDLDDYIDYLISMFHFLGPDTHVVAVCQPAVPVFAAVALMEEMNDPYTPTSMTLMGGPIDTRENPTEVNRHAGDHGLDWFRRNVITPVPWPHPGFMREVYPGFLQLGGFMSMNLDRHMTAHRSFYDFLVQGDGDSAGKHREFYDEYLAVMDLTAEFFLQTVDTVFIRQALPHGTMRHRGHLVRPDLITRTALLTVEGEKDDISGLGQTKAAHRLAPNIPEDKRYHYMQPGVGHYGVFNGSRFRSEIAPRITDFILTHDQASRGSRRAAAPPPPPPEAPMVDPVVAVAPVPSPEAVAASVAVAKAVVESAGASVTPEAAAAAKVVRAAAKPKAVKPAPAKSTVGKSTVGKSATAKSATAKSAAGEAATARSATAKSAAGKSATATSGATKSASAKSAPANPASAKPVPPKPTAAKAASAEVPAAAAPAPNTARRPAKANPAAPAKTTAPVATPPTAEPAPVPATDAAGTTTPAKTARRSTARPAGRRPRAPRA